MYRCLPKKKNPASVELAVYTFAFVFIVAFLIYFWDELNLWDAALPIRIFVYCVVVLAVITPMVAMVVSLDKVLWGASYYRIAEDGIHIYKKPYNERIVPWRDIEDGRICYIFYVNRFVEPIPMFRFSLNKTRDEKKRNRNVFLRHYPKMYDYTYISMNQKTVLAFYYDAVAEKEIRAHYPMLHGEYMKPEDGLS